MSKVWTQGEQSPYGHKRNQAAVDSWKAKPNQTQEKPSWYGLRESKAHMDTRETKLVYGLRESKAYMDTRETKLVLTQGEPATTGTR